MPLTYDEAIRAILIFDEGITLIPYKDSLGFWTGGVGHLLAPGEELTYKHGIPDWVVEKWFTEDIATAKADMIHIFTRATIESWSDARQWALINMAFNLGRSKLEKFKDTIHFIKTNQWDHAATCALRSLWAKQVGKRSVRVTNLMKNKTSDYRL